MTILHPSSRKQLMLQLLNKRNRAQNPISKGFTLIELLVVIVILGVLGAVGYQAYINQIERANQATAATAAVAAAKACAANLVIEDPDFDISNFVDNTTVTIEESAACSVGTIYTVTAGADGPNPQVRTAQIGSGGAVCPGGCD